MIDTALLFENIRGNWWAAIIFVVLVVYFIFSVIWNYVKLAKINKEKKKYEDELVLLEKQYDEQIKILQAKREEGKKFMKDKGDK